MNESDMERDYNTVSVPVMTAKIDDQGKPHDWETVDPPNEIRIRTYLHISYTCPKCGDHASYSTMATSKPNQVECTQCRTVFNVIQDGVTNGET